MTADTDKQDVARQALTHIKDGMLVALGTGSTTTHFIRFLAEAPNLTGITCVTTSLASTQLAESLGLTVLDPNDVSHIDICVDGADEIDPGGNMIKGGGGALMREKLIASHAATRIYIADTSKCVATLGAFPLAVEVLPFGRALTQRAIAALGAEASLRIVSGEPFVTDNGNNVLDCRFGAISDPAALNRRLTDIPGVLETGLFISMADRLITKWDGRVREVAGFDPKKSWEDLLGHD